MNVHLPKRIVIIAETRESWAKHGPAAKTNPDNLEKLKYFLPRNGDIYDLYKEVAVVGEFHNVEVQFIRLNSGKELYERLSTIIDEPLIIWSLSDGQGHYRGGHLHSFASILGIPCFGSSTAVQSICSNKYISSLSLLHANVKVPWSCYLEGDTVLSCHPEKLVSGPFFVKPNHLGSQIGINRNSLAKTWKDAINRSIELKKEFNTRAIVQKYIKSIPIRVSHVSISGRDTFGVNYLKFVGSNGECEDFPMDSVDNHTEWKTTFVKNTEIPENTFTQIERICSVAKEYLKVKDYFGFDSGISENGDVFIFEINTLPYVNKVFLEYANELGYSSVGECFFYSLVESFNKQLPYSRWTEVK
jgi:D-alanine-D-alanine ligase-like ATP-grasp enzyme